MEKSARPRTALNECVKVVVRCRPLSEKEKNEGHEEVRHGCFVDVKTWVPSGLRRRGASSLIEIL